MTPQSLLRGLATLSITLLGLAATVQAETDWSGAVSTDASNPANWSANPPTIGGTNPLGLRNGTGNNIVYSSNATTIIGTLASGSGLSWLGTFANTNTLTVTAGTLSLNGAFSADGGTESIWIGNGPGSNGTLKVDGGNVSVLNGTLLGRDFSTGTLMVTNGTFSTGVFTSAVGMYIGAPFNSPTSFGLSKVNIGDAGTVSVTAPATDPLKFGTLSASESNTTSNFLIFTSGSTGTLKLNLTTATLGSGYFTSLITNGYVKIGTAVVTDPTRFSINTTNLAEATLSVAPPSGGGTGSSLKWTGSVGANWTTALQGSPFNWRLISDNSGKEFSTNDNALFDDTATGSTTVSIPDADVNPGAVTFNNSTKNYTVSTPNGYYGIGTGTLTKSGTGTVTLLTPNAYAGATTISAGTLQLGDGTPGNNGTITNSAYIVNNGNLIFNTYDAPEAYNGEIKGTGHVTKLGSGTTTLGGDNSFTGGVTVTEGILVSQLSATALGANDSASTVAIGAAALVLINQNTSTTINQTFSGSGKLLFNFNGGGDTVANNFNSFTGVIGIAGDGSNNKLINPKTTTQLTNSTIEIESGGQLFVNSSTTNIANLKMVSNGNGENRGAIRLNNGTVNVSGTISLLGDTVIGNEGGTLNGNISTAISGTQTLTMGTDNSSGTALLGGNLSDGSGVLALTNFRGTTTLAGTNTYTGPTTITGGSLIVNGSLAAASSVTVENGNTLAGTGIVNGTVTTIGTSSVIAPGVAGIGTLAVGNTNLTGILSIELDATNGDLLSVNGNITLDAGSTFTITEIAPVATNRYVLVKYTGTLTGTFTPPALPSGYALIYDTTAKEIYITKSVGFSAYMDNFPGLSADQRLPNADPDKDGIPNLVEYALAGFDPTVTNGSPGSLAGKVLSFSKRPVAVSNGDLNYAIEESKTLGAQPNPWTVVTPTVNNSTTISYTFPNGPTMDFARLKIVQNP